MSWETGRMAGEFLVFRQYWGGRQWGVGWAEEQWDH